MELRERANSEDTTMNHTNLMEGPLISIITVAYNSAATIEKTIKSVLDQTYQNYEYYIIDGESSDDTVEIAKKYENLFSGRMHIISEKDTGIYNAMNKGIKLCKGEVIGIVNSDDRYASETLACVAWKYIEENHPFLIINGDMVRVSNEDEEIYRYHFTQKNIDRKEYFGHPAMFAARAVYDLIGLYDESFKLAADGEWQYRAHDNEKVRYVLCDEVFNYMREGGASDNIKYCWKWFNERVRMKISHKRANRIEATAQELWAMFKTVIKNLTPKKWQGKVYSIRYKTSGVISRKH